MGHSIGRVFRPIESAASRRVETARVELPSADYSPAGLWRNIRAARQAVADTRCDVAHITGTEHYLLPFLSGTRTVVTVHDIGFFTNHPHRNARGLVKYAGWLRTLPLADHCTFISAKTEREVRRYVSFKPGRSSVVPDAVGDEFRHTPKAIDTARPRILHISAAPNKNLERTIEALRGLPCHLRIIGRLSDAQKELLGRSGVEHSAATDISDEQMLREYEACDMVNFPSLYEGFGMPIVEGQALGRPVLTSRREPMEWVAGGAAALADPESVESIREGHMEIRRRADELVTLGLRNARRFAPDTVAGLFIDIYNKVCASSSGRTH